MGRRLLEQACWPCPSTGWQETGLILGVFSLTGGWVGKDCQCFLWLKLANRRQVFLAKAIQLASASTRIRIQKPWLSIAFHSSILQHSQSLGSHTHENWGCGIVENLWVIFKRDWWNQAWNGAKNILTLGKTAFLFWPICVLGTLDSIFRKKTQSRRISNSPL